MPIPEVGLWFTGPGEERTRPQQVQNTLKVVKNPDETFSCSFRFLMGRKYLTAVGHAREASGCIPAVALAAEELFQQNQEN